MNFQNIRIEKESKLSEIAASTLNSTLKDSKNTSDKKNDICFWLNGRVWSILYKHSARSNPPVSCFSLLFSAVLLYCCCYTIVHTWVRGFFCCVMCFIAVLRTLLYCCSTRCVFHGLFVFVFFPPAIPAPR